MLKTTLLIKKDELQSNQCNFILSGRLKQALLIKLNNVYLTEICLVKITIHHKNKKKENIFFYFKVYE